VARLGEECRLLREQLVDLHAEHDLLTTTVGPNLEADYLLQIGGRQVEFFRLQIECRRLRRMIEMAMAETNRGRAPDPEGIARALAEEFALWEAQVRARAEAVREAGERMKHLLSPQDSAELRRIYRLLARRLHPDLNPQQEDHHRALWIRTTDCHRRGDLAGLQALLLFLEGESGELPPATSLDTLTAERDRLARSVVHLQGAITALRQTHPFTLEELLADPARVEELRQDIRRQMDEAELEARRLRSIWEALVNHGAGTRPH
jgi:hypothetical protein